MDDGVDPMLRDERRHARLISAVADHQRRARRHCPVETGREIVEHHDALARIDQSMDHMAADIAGAAGNQDRHAARPLRSTAIAAPRPMKNRLMRACTGSRMLTRPRAPT
jgi:hypothetical protein